MPSEDELPTLVGWSWKVHAPRQYPCGTTAIAAWRRPLDEIETVPGEDQFAYIVSDPGEYLLAHGVRRIDIPRYYSRFHDDFEPVVAEWTAKSYGRAVGIDANLLTSTVRLAEGKGHIDHDALALYLCDNNTLVVIGSRGAFIVDLVPLREWTLSETPPDSARVDIQGFAVPEADADYQRGLRRFVEIFEAHTDATLAHYKRLADGKHIFETGSGDDVYAGPQLRPLARMTVDETDLYQTYSHHFDGEVRLSTWDGDTTSHTLGEETRRGVVVGYDHAWNEKEPIMGGGVYEVESNVTYWCFQPRPEMYSYFDFEIVSFTETIDTFTDRD